jgi:hypothetical protein
MLDPRACYQPFWMDGKEAESLNVRTDSQRVDCVGVHAVTSDA